MLLAADVTVDARRARVILPECEVAAMSTGREALDDIVMARRAFVLRNRRRGTGDERDGEDDQDSSESVVHYTTSSPVGDLKTMRLMTPRVAQNAEEHLNCG